MPILLNKSFHEFNAYFSIHACLFKFRRYSHSSTIPSTQTRTLVLQKSGYSLLILVKFSVNLYIPVLAPALFTSDAYWYFHQVISVKSYLVFLLFLNFHLKIKLLQNCVFFQNELTQLAILTQTWQKLLLLIPELPRKAVNLKHRPPAKDMYTCIIKISVSCTIISSHAAPTGISMAKITGKLKVWHIIHAWKTNHQWYLILQCRSHVL